MVADLLEASATNALLNSEGDIISQIKTSTKGVVNNLFLCLLQATITLIYELSDLVAVKSFSVF